MAGRRLGQLGARSSVMLLCDVQEKFRHTVAFFPQIVSVAARMLQVMRLMDVPVLVTEQYPKGLGPTVSELNITGFPKFSKTSFTMVTPEVLEELTGVGNIRSVVLCGIETQACISATVLDLMAQDFDVHLVADACSSRSQVDRLFSFERLRQSGAFITTSEAVIFQLLKDAKHPCFRDVQKLIMDQPAADSGLLEMFGQKPAQ